MVTLYPIVHHRMVLQLLVVIGHKLRYLHLIPPHLVPKKLQPCHIVDFAVQPVCHKSQATTLITVRYVLQRVSYVKCHTSIETN